MRIIHTADIHLNNPNDEKYEALEYILNLCSMDNYNIDLLTISGDLFHSKKNIFNLKKSLRELFDTYMEKESFFKSNFKVLIIPGNHDEEFYTINDNLGTNVELLCDKNVCVYKSEDINVVGVPFCKEDFDSIISEIEDVKEDSKINMLMIHCTLDFPDFKREGFGEEQKYRYLPISTEQLKYLDFDYVLAGHFHSNFITKPYLKSPDSKKNWFIYPGSPVKITRNEQGKRKVCLIDTEKNQIKPIILDTLFYDYTQILFHPYKLEEGYDQINEFVKKYKNDLEKKIADLEIFLEGYISIPEKDFKEEIEKIICGVKYNNNVFQVIELLNKPLFKRFKELLKEKEMEQAKKDKLLDFVIGAF